MHDPNALKAHAAEFARWSTAPDFWLADLPRGSAFLKTLTTASCQVIGKSAGQREIVAIEYGAREDPQTSCDNLQSALDATPGTPDPTCIFPEAFYGKHRRRKPVLAIQGGIHGGELTGTVALFNLCAIIESGKDLRGKAWPRLQSLARATRLLLIPWLNPDGVARSPFSHTANIPESLAQLGSQGIAEDGTPFTYPASKLVFPIPPEKVRYMGSYYNDGGVNLQYDFCCPTRQPETLAWMRYYLRERPDGILIFHCNAGTMIGPPGYFLPPGHQHQISRIGGAVSARLLRDGYDLGRLSWATLPGMGKPSIDQIDATYHVCGATPIMVELPAGTAIRPFTCDQMLEIGLITIEEILEYAHRDGLRPYEFWNKVKATLP